jgi:hypothetical protein
MRPTPLITLIALSCTPSATTLDSPLIAQMQQGASSGAASFDHAPLDALLATHVTTDGLVRYDALAKDRTRLDNYLQSIAKIDMSTLPAPEQKALLINAYNAYTLALILDNLPSGITSIRQIDSPWKQERFVVAGHTLSLDNIEHNLLRPTFRDPRIHFALNCASIGCPPLRPHAFHPDALDQELDMATRDALARPRWCKLDGGKLHLTKLLDWYGADMTAPDASPRADSIPAWVARFAPQDVAAHIAQHHGQPPVTFMEYDWQLNRAP